MKGGRSDTAAGETAGGCQHPWDWEQREEVRTLRLGVGPHGLAFCLLSSGPAGPVLVPLSGGRGIYDMPKTSRNTDSWLEGGSSFVPYIKRIPKEKE